MTEVIETRKSEHKQAGGTGVPTSFAKHLRDYSSGKHRTSFSDAGGGGGGGDGESSPQTRFADLDGSGSLPPPTPHSNASLDAAGSSFDSGGDGHEHSSSRSVFPLMEPLKDDRTAELLGAPHGIGGSRDYGSIGINGSRDGFGLNPKRPHASIPEILGMPKSPDEALPLSVFDMDRQQAAAQPKVRIARRLSAAQNSASASGDAGSVSGREEAGVSAAFEALLTLVSEMRREQAALAAQVGALSSEVKGLREESRLRSGSAAGVGGATVGAGLGGGGGVKKGLVFAPGGVGHAHAPRNALEHMKEEAVAKNAHSKSFSFGLGGGGGGGSFDRGSQVPVARGSSLDPAAARADAKADAKASGSRGSSAGNPGAPERLVVAKQAGSASGSSGGSGASSARPSVRRPSEHRRSSSEGRALMPSKR